MKPEKKKTNFNDLFSEINKDINIEDPIFIKDSKKEKDKSSFFKNAIENIFSGVQEGIDMWYELKNKDYEINSERAREIINIIKSYKKEETINYEMMVYSLLMFFSGFIVIFSSMDIKFSLTIFSISVFIFIYNLLAMIVKENKEIKKFKEELEKVPVVFKSNKINFNMMIFSALRRDGDQEFNNALKEHIQNVIKEEEWIYLDKNTVKMKLLNKYIESIENKMNNFK